MTFRSSCASDASHRRDRKKSMLLHLESSQVNHACAKYTLVCETSYLHSICIPSTPSHLLICSRIRSSSANPEGPRRTCTRPLILMMVSDQDSVVFYYKTTMWSCLSRTTCAHVVAEPAHVLELTTVVHFPRISQRHLVDLCCKLSFSF